MMEVVKKGIAEFNLPANVSYHQEHAWACQEGDVVRVGISDYAQDQLGDVIFVETPHAGDHFNRGEEFGAVESAKSVSTLYMPVSGEIMVVNEELESAPELINKEPYGAGWILLVKPDNRDNALGGLLTHEAYKSVLMGK
jgi:glycine cleavage system H protein